MSDLIPVNRILPYSVVDGPGNRVAVFVQKCNIGCLYCHNPETQNLCFNCGRCVETCPAKALSLIDGKVIWDKEKCVMCDTCIRVCENHASPKVTLMNCDEIYEEIRKSYPFIRGITVSGGEVTLYAHKLIDLFRMVRADGLTVLLDSNGTFDFSSDPELLDNIDGVMLDVKSWDPKVFKALTGGDNTNVKKNIVFLKDSGKLEELRIVSLENYVDAEECIRGTAGLTDVSDVLLKLIRFRRFGVKGELSDHPSPSMEYMKKLEKLAYEAGFRRVMIL